MGSKRMSDDPATVIAQLKYWGVVAADLLEGRDPTPALEALDGLEDLWLDYLEEHVKLVQKGALSRDRLISWMSHHCIDHHITRLQNMLPAFVHTGARNRARLLDSVSVDYATHRNDRPSEEVRS